MDRPLRVDVAEARADDFNKPKREYNNRNFNNSSNNRERGNRQYNNRNSDSPNERRDNNERDNKERTKIELLPRSGSNTVTSTNSSEELSDAYSTSANPFGLAKPRDEKAALNKIEERKRTEEDKTTTGAPATRREDRPPREDRPREDRPRRDNNNRSPRREDRPRRDNNAPRKFDDKSKNNKESRSRDENKQPRAPRPQENKPEQVN